jgi:signal recognition particle GTPase
MRQRLIEALTLPSSSLSSTTNSSNNNNNSNNTTIHTNLQRKSELEKGPTIFLIIGANGMGKTTTIGKLAGK